MVYVCLSASLANVPCLYSSKAALSSSFVFMTIGPYQATGSPIGLPDIRRNLTPSSPAVTSMESHRGPGFGVYYANSAKMEYFSLQLQTHRSLSK